MSYQVEMFPDVIMKLQQEIYNHPDLLVKLAAMQPGSDTWEKFATVLTYCNIAVDGEYDEPQILELSEMCLNKLLAIRVPIVLFN